MPRLLNPLVYDLLDIAQGLSEVAGRENLRRAARRRAVSTAYYAVFHALCYVCSAELVGWSRSSGLEPIYRSVEHGFARERLASPEAAALGTEIIRLGSTVATLQERRHASDYASPALQGIDRNWVEVSLQMARQAIELIERMEASQRKGLAILLIARPRRSGQEARRNKPSP